MYRVYLYMLTANERPEDAERYNGHNRFGTYEAAERQLDLDMSRGATGGGIERHVKGIGWCLTAGPEPSEMIEA